MPNKMLIDSTHPEETRVVVLRGNRVEEFDFESAHRKQLRGNIYLAKVTRVEPSLQAAFVDYGGNRHGFLAFSEIHPDYYQIPVADRQALIDEEERAQRAAEAEADDRAKRRSERGSHRRRDTVRSEPVEGEAMAAASEFMAPLANDADEHVPEQQDIASPAADGSDTSSQPVVPIDEAPIALTQLESASAAEPMPAGTEEPTPTPVEASDAPEPAAAAATADEFHGDDGNGDNVTNGDNITEISSNSSNGDEEAIESVGGADAMEEVPERTHRPRVRQYKIQEVIKRRQVMLVQVVKEERGTKGAALTTYLSLAGRYSVLMPNTARGGGISRKITDSQDRRRLKEVAQELEVPEGMGVILRTAGAARTKTEVKRDFEYLLRLWETVRDLTLKSTAPTLVYEEGSLIKRSIRDLYNKDIDEILVAGDEGYKEAKDFMRMLMPSHAKNVKSFRDTQPVFSRFGIESQLDAMFQPVVQLRSGGYIVINQAEALVAIDVNSGRATREHHIEDTALKTNLEAAEEIARQLRLRDLAGLVVIDFIDMDEKRNNRTVERRMKEALRHDRARIQVGHISHFGLLEMSRQRIRSSVLESSTEKCPHCGGSGHMRSVSSVALQLLRSLEETLLKGATHNFTVRTRTEIALYLLNYKRAHLRALEERFQITIMVNADTTITGQTSYVIDKGELVHSLEQAKAIAAQQPPTLVPEQPDEADDDGASEASEGAEIETADTSTSDQPDETHAEGENGGRGRRRRRRGPRGGEGREGVVPDDHAPEHAAVGEDVEASSNAGPGDDEGGHDVATGERGDGDGRRRRRGRRGGRRNRRGRDGERQHSPSDPVAAFDAELSSAEPESRSYIEPIFEQGAADALQQREETHAHEPAQPRADAPETPSPAPPPAPPAAESSEPERPRRRSTVREPAPTSLSNESSDTPVSAPAAELPQPVVSSADEGDDAGRPRRSGWWSRRVLGKS
ncbi:MAG: Rne/Rng family ribonuclease [Xanthobacteraceae bacterium]